MDKKSSKKHHNQIQKRTTQQNPSPNKSAGTVEVNWNYLVKVLSTLMLISQTMLMYKYKLVTAENALKQIDILLDGWVKHS